MEVPQEKGAIRHPRKGTRVVGQTTCLGEPALAVEMGEVSGEDEHVMAIVPDVDGAQPGPDQRMVVHPRAEGAPADQPERARSVEEGRVIAAVSQPGALHPHRNHAEHVRHPEQPAFLVRVPEGALLEREHIGIEVGQHGGLSPQPPFQNTVHPAEVEVPADGPDVPDADAPPIP